MVITGAVGNAGAAGIGGTVTGAAISPTGANCETGATFAGGGACETGGAMESLRGDTWISGVAFDTILRSGIGGVGRESRCTVGVLAGALGTALTGARSIGSMRVPERSSTSRLASSSSIVASGIRAVAGALTGALALTLSGETTSTAASSSGPMPGNVGRTLRIATTRDSLSGSRFSSTTIAGFGVSRMRGPLGAALGIADFATVVDATGGFEGATELGDGFATAGFDAAAFDADAAGFAGVTGFAAMDCGTGMGCWRGAGPDGRGGCDFVSPPGRGTAGRGTALARGDGLGLTRAFEDAMGAICCNAHSFNRTVRFRGDGTRYPP